MREKWLPGPYSDSTNSSLVQWYPVSNTPGNQGVSRTLLSKRLPGENYALSTCHAIILMNDWTSDELKELRGEEQILLKGQAGQLPSERTIVLSATRFLVHLRDYQVKGFSWKQHHGFKRLPLARPRLVSRPFASCAFLYQVFIG